MLLALRSLYEGISATALPAGVAAAAAVNNPLGLVCGLPAGVAASSAENNPRGVVVALPAGVTASVAEHDPAGVGVVVIFGGGGAPGKRPQPQRTWQKLPEPEKAAPPISISAVALPPGVSATCALGPCTAFGSGTALVAGFSGLWAQSGTATAKGIRNPTDDELTLILMAA